MRESLVMPDRKSGGIRETLKTLVYAVGIALVVRTFAFEPFNIPSGSMKPTLLVGDYLFVSKFAYGYSRFSLPLGLPLFSGRVLERLPERGDVVVFKLPSDNKTDYIKRVVGLPGDRVQVRDGVLYINGEAVKLEPAGEFDEEFDGRAVPVPQYREKLPGGRTHLIMDLTPTGSLDNTGVFHVPPGHIFAMGDNRDNSLDSRVENVGFIPVENLIGRAELLFFSVNGHASFWEPWTWPWGIRYDRLFRLIQ
ncbi:signal peptidase I [Benzoatithermus flavus]|uniref:Signal peptidase I n=1 Tax=Benzoatithermus flavus TaxID=3108223 RepID=A0ABU8XR76_9PROT